MSSEVLTEALPDEYKMMLAKKRKPSGWFAGERSPDGASFQRKATSA